MGKRKLRNCSKCGTRHGPPTGKNCSRKEEVLMNSQPEEDDAHSVKSFIEDGVDSQKSSCDQERCDQVVGYTETHRSSEWEIFPPGSFVQYAERHGEEAWGAAGAIAQPS